jgi:hypothetical protein
MMYDFQWIYGSMVPGDTSDKSLLFYLEYSIKYINQRGDHRILSGLCTLERYTVTEKTE